MQTETQNLHRRTVLAGAAWSVPIIALAAAVPAAAASGAVEVELFSEARLPVEARDGVHDGLNYYQGTRTLSFLATYTNSGPDDLPVGGHIDFGLPFASAWNTTSLSIIKDDAGMNPTALAPFTMDITAEGQPTAFRQVWRFALNSPAPAGTSFEIAYQVTLNSTSTTATNGYRARVYTNISTGSSGATETTTGNNAGYSAFYAYFNNQNASG